MTRDLIGSVEYLSYRSILTEAIRSSGAIAHLWRKNANLERVTMFKSNSHLRLLRAARLARELTAAGIGHLHAHWPYATQIAYLVNRLTGIPFSISIHAHEVEYDYGHFPSVFESVSFA